MRQQVLAFLVLCVLVGLACNEAFARGRGGPGAGPGARAGGAGAAGIQGRAGGPNIAPRNGAGPAGGAAAAQGSRAGEFLRSNSGKASGQAAAWAQSRPPAFSPAWYAQHPTAWRATHPHADAVAVATAAGLATWLAIPAVGAVSTTTVVESAPATQPAAESPGTTDQSGSMANTLAQSGAADAKAAGEWLPLGVFALQPTGSADATRMLQLSVNRDGLLRGDHFDVLSEETQAIKGAIDKTTQRVAWTIGKGGRVVFQSTLADLTQPEGAATAFFPDGKSSAWQLKQTAAPK